MRSSMTGDDVINYKEKKVGQSFKTHKSSKKSVGTSTSKQRSGGGPISTTVPPSKPNSPTKKEDRSKSKTSDNLSVSQLQSEHQ